MYDKEDPDKKEQQEKGLHELREFSLGLEVHGVGPGLVRRD